MSLSQASFCDLISSAEGTAAYRVHRRSHMPGLPPAEAKKFWRRIVPQFDAIGLFDAIDSTGLETLAVTTRC